MTRRPVSNFYAVKILAGLPLILAAQMALATPQTVRVDGAIFDSAGLPLTASKDIQIKAYDAASGGSLLWTSAVYNSLVSAGRFTINMNAAAGSVPSLLTQISGMTATQGVYFQIEVDSGAANGVMNSAQIILPRVRARGTMFALGAASADALTGVTSTVFEHNQLVGVTGSIQAQLNAKATGANYILKAGDTMTGDLGLSGSQATINRVLTLDSSRRVASSAITSSELLYLSGVSLGLSPIANALQGVTGIVLGGYLSGVTASLQSQLNAKSSSANSILKAGDTMTGDLGLSGSQATISRALILDSSRRVASSTVTDVELGRLSGVTVGLSPIANALQGVTGLVLGNYLSGVTANVQTQINAARLGNAPNAFSFTNQSGVTVSSTVTSNTVTLTGWTGALTGVCTGCTAIIRNGVTGSTMGGFLPNDTVAMQVTSGLSGTTVTASLTVGTTTSSPWQVTTNSSTYTPTGFTQSSIYSSMSAASVANMSDGDGTTGTGTNSSSEWIQMDLGSTKSVGWVKVGGGNLNFWGAVSPYLNGATLQYSTDAVSWTTITTISGVTDSGGSQFPTFNFTPVSARYLRLSMSSYLATTEFLAGF